MQPDNDAVQALRSKDFMDAMIRLGLLAMLVALCIRVVSPFVHLILWALVLAVAIYPLHQRLAAKMGGRQGRCSTLMVLVAVLALGIPLLMLGNSFIDHIQDLRTAFQNNALTLEQPDPGVAEWPLVGEKIYASWSAAAENLPAFVENNRAQLDVLAKKLLAMVSGAAGGLALFIASLIIAGIMMAYGKSGGAAMRRIYSRLIGPDKGPQMLSLSVATIISVAAGVIGVAFLQAVLLGFGFVMSGIPAGGVLALFVLVLGIAQVPAAVIGLPAIVYLWVSGDASTTSNIVWTIYLVIAGLSDNVLKPLLLGRGVDVPMPVILIGALGGMVTGGFLGLFLGAVLLALAYRLFMEWVGTGGATIENGADTAGNEVLQPAGGE